MHAPRLSGHVLSPLSGHLDRLASVTTPLADRFGRVATDLRVSLTDRCNLRCTYCMPAEGLDWLPDRADAHRRRGRPAGHDRRRAARRPRGPVHRRRAAAAARAGRHRRPHARARRRDLADHQRARAWRARRRRWPRPASTGSTSASTRSARRPSATITRRDRLDDVVAGLEAAQAAGLGPVKVNAVLLRGINDDQAAELLRWCRRARLRAALHRADAAGRPARLEPRRRWSPPTRSSSSSTAEFTLTPTASRGGARPAELFLVDGGPADGRHHRLGHPAVLRRLRPRPAHRRRPGPQLPVRPRGVRPAYGAARAAPPTRRSPSAGASRCGASAPATASTTRRSCSPTGRCRRSAASFPPIPPTPCFLMHSPSPNTLHLSSPGVTLLLLTL